MHKIIKVLNNNTVLASDDTQEVIIMSKGIGFSKKADEVFEVPTNAKRYIMQKSLDDVRKSSKIIEYIDPIYLEVAAEILRLTAIKFEKVDNTVLLPLADHIYYAVKRMNENIMPSNPFIYDIRLLFPDEYIIGEAARKVIKKYVGKDINEDEIGFITLHIHSAVSSNQVADSMEAVRIVNESIADLQESLHIVIDVESISYVRLMNHIKFLILRLSKDEELQMNISEFTKDRFPFAYEQSVKMCNALSKALKKELPKAEVGYLALHLERILSSIE